VSLTRGWAADAVAKMSDAEIRRVVSEGAGAWRDMFEWIVPSSYGAGEMQDVIEEVERLCEERVHWLESGPTEYEELEGEDEIAA